MPENNVREKARRDAREGKSASTQAGEFVREEMHHVREGVHSARSPKQIIAIGLSKARRAGVKLPPPAKGKSSAAVRHRAESDLAHGRKDPRARPSRTRSRAVSKALKRESHRSADPGAVSRQAAASARKRGPVSRRKAAMKAVRTKGRKGLQSAARKAARTRGQT